MEKEIRTIILPGYSLHNKVWANEIKTALGKDGIDAFVHEWMHWKRGFFVAEREVQKVIEEIGQGNVNIIAKSVGTRITAKLLKTIPEKLNKVILCGIPFRGMHEGAKNNISVGLMNFDPHNVIIFQNSQDPLGSYKLIRDFVWGIDPQIPVIDMPRKDHNYPYPIDFTEFIMNA